MRERIRELLKKLGIDALLVTDPFNMRYISGFRGGEGIVYLSNQQFVLITDSRYTQAAGRESDFHVIEENSLHKRDVILTECIESDNIRRLGFEDRSMRFSELLMFQKNLPRELSWVPVRHAVDDMRMIKTPEELKNIAKAEAIGDKAFSEIIKKLRPGMTELIVAAELEYQMKLHGAHGISFDTIIASGINSSMPHAIPSEKKLEKGDFITMDFGCIYNGYCSDMTRTVVLGKANKKQKEIYETVLKAQEACLAVVRDGISGAEADKAAREIITAAGYGDCFGHGTGHSVGLYIHEEPRISPNDNTILRAGMTQTVEPGIYVPNFGGVRIEDLVVVRENGCEDLTHSPKELIEL